MPNNKTSRETVVAIVANTLWYVVNFRLSLILRLKKSGYKVLVISQYESKSIDILINLGVLFENVSFCNTGVSVYNEIIVVRQIILAIRKYAVQILVSYTPKANISCGFAAICTCVEYIPNISGFGVIINKGWFLKNIVFFLYRCVLWNAGTVFIQNQDDFNKIVLRGIVGSKKCKLLPGSGVNIERFEPVRLNFQIGGELIFLFASRLLWDKGIGLFVEAARKVRQRFPNAVFKVLGFIDEGSTYSVCRSDVQSWVAEGVIEYIGVKDDVRPYIAECHCVVLPSFYGEGIPRILLEAAAMTRPIITTDSVGCRETVVDGMTGFICKPRDSEDLAKVMFKFISMPYDVRANMGKEGRRRIEKYFNEDIVLDAYEFALRGLVK